MSKSHIRTAVRTHGFTESVIREMTRVANEHGALNLAQGFPDFPCPDVLKEAACAAIRADVNQYAVTWGAPRMRRAIAAWYARDGSEAPRPGQSPCPPAAIAPPSARAGLPSRSSAR